MKRNRKWLFLAALFVLALPLMFTGNAAAYITHLDGATINSSGGWDMPELGDCPNAVNLGDSSQQTRQSCANIGFPNYTDSTACTAAPNYNWRSACTLPYGDQVTCEANGGDWWDTTALDGTGGGTTCTAALDDISSNADNCTAAGGTYASQCGSHITFTGTYDGNDACLRCHNSSTQYNRNPIRWKDAYLMTGHRNMLKEVGTNNIPLGGPEWTAGEGGSSPYAGINFGDGSVAYLWGGWYRNSVSARLGQHAKTPDSPSTVTPGNSYCGKYCHATGANAVDATTAPILGVTGGNWVDEGVQCTRCHDNSGGTPEDPTPGTPGSHHDTVPEEAEVTELCYQCHEQGGVEPGTEVGAGWSHGHAVDEFAGHYRTNQFLNSPHARFEGTAGQVGDIANYDSHFENYGGTCTTCHDIHIGSADPANTDQSHIIRNCGVECHNPQSPYSHGGYGGFHDGFGGLAPDTTAAAANCSVSDLTQRLTYDTESDCLAEGGYWNEAGTTGNNTTACVRCHMGPGTNHLWRNNVDPDYSPFPDPPATNASEGFAQTYDAEDSPGYPAVGNSVDEICGQCHYTGGVATNKFTKAELAVFAEDYHQHEAASSGSTAAYARFNWYQGAACYQVNFDGSDNDSTCSWDFNGEGSSTDCVTSFTFSSAGTKQVTLTTAGGTRTMAVTAKAVNALPTTVMSVAVDGGDATGMTLEVTDGSSASGCAGVTIATSVVIWGDGTTTVAATSTGPFAHQYNVPGTYTISYSTRDSSGNKSFSAPQTWTVPDLATSVCDVEGDITGTSILIGTKVTVKEGATVVKLGQTDTLGHYSIPNVTAGHNYDVIPSRNGYEFTPASIGLTLDCGVNNTANDFTASSIW